MPAIIQQIVEKTDEVPLFVEEITKAFLELGVLREINGDYELSCTPAARYQTRFKTRSWRAWIGSAKSVTQFAAAIGRQFSYQLLRAASPHDETILQRELTQLVEVNLLGQQQRPL